MLPYSLIEDYINLINFDFKIISKKIIPFRSHYIGIEKWVDNLKYKYKEMSYIVDKNNLYEELMLWEIWRK